MKKLLATLVLAASLLGISSCSTGVRGLYISGYSLDFTSSAGIGQAYYLKDGNKEILSPDKLGVATSVFVSEYDVYVSGFYVDASATHIVGCYWKNGELFDLDSGNNDANASAIYVDGDDVYTAGFYTDATTSKMVAAYWKNGVMTALEAGADDSFATAITMSDGDVYVSGLGEGGQGVYWKNGTKVVVEATSAVAFAIQVVGTDVYTAGSWDEGLGSQAVYWKNTTVTKLTGATTEALASSIQVVGTDVYVAGLYSDFEKVAYWKNGVKTDLALDSAYIPAGPESGFFNGLPVILVNETDVHVICLLAETATTTLFSGYWLNGTFSKSADNDAYSGLFLK